MADFKTEHADHGGYEKSDANIKMIVVSAAIITVVVIASFIVVRLVFVAMQKDIDRLATPVPAMFESDLLPPAPRLRVNGQAKLATLHAYEDELLNSYEWVDHELGLVRIPIERAKQILLERGEQSFPVPEPIIEDEADAPARSETH